MCADNYLTGGAGGGGGGGGLLKNEATQLIL